METGTFGGIVLFHHSDPYDRVWGFAVQKISVVEAVCRVLSTGKETAPHETSSQNG